MIIISGRQSSGYYQCNSITVRFGDEVWDEARVKRPDGTEQDLVLVYSYFNGVYVKDESRTSEGRPVYVEMKKTDWTSFDLESPVNPYGYQERLIKPAEIKYCNGHWIFSHDHIEKSNNKNKHDSDSGCRWLARSEETEGFDLLNVAGSWQLWVGAIGSTEVSVACNECSDDTDCNLNGSCNAMTHECMCDADEGVTYLGYHCEVKLVDECRTILGEDESEWSIVVPSWSKETGEMFSSYGRPVYNYVGGLTSELETKVGTEYDDVILMYSGARWFTMVLQEALDEQYSDIWAWRYSNYHPFWMEVFSPGTTMLISDPTTKDTPVGADFYFVESFIRAETSNQFGPFGALSPLQNITDRGWYRCKVEICTFCPQGNSAGDDFIIPGSPDNTTCGQLRDYAAYRGVKQNSDECQLWQPAEFFCCPSNDDEQSSVISIDEAMDAASNGAAQDPSLCSFCPTGISAEEDYVVPESGGTTCGQLYGYAKSLEDGSEMCQQVQLAEQVCCVP